MDFDPVSTVMVWISTFGLLGLFTVALTERFVPVMPSYGLLLAVGIAAAEGTWSLPGALLASGAGSLVGCAACFYAVRVLGETRSRRLVFGAGRLFGMSTERTDRWIGTFRRNQTVLAFSLQLLPTVRLFAPAFAALLRGPSGRFLAATAAGIAVWNGVFVTAGYIAAHTIDTANATVLALGVLGGVLAVEAAVIGIGHSLRARCAPKVALHRN
ncbi:membrane protein DedA with SNARE-associated domain [Ancylobacter aquaticus]|uniref:Membrane protein DedA with SNARE-associated domain n=1 Tax=Ancylobacter aquaticus TaxID=100 RepID=A0A4R1IC91_ANCAQ|nr:VTT domain-containing protein [Ancylobacter aquaticus]TCK28152.1 membrane protein DedA with SNARE-associated domain [Ancylobacter aquaticus]